MTHNNSSSGFYGWRVARSAFVLAMFGWGLGFYGPPVFLATVRETTGWPLVWISSAVSLHFLTGALSGANLPTLHRRFGAARVTQLGALLLAAGVTSWAASSAPWQLFVSALLSGLGWGTMSAAALNLLVSPWFVRSRPAALGLAFNGGSVGSIVFSPLWVALITAVGFTAAASAIALVMLITVVVLAQCVFSKTPQGLGVQADGDVPGTPVTIVTSRHATPLPGALLWRDRAFITLAAGMALGMFAQLGLTVHLYSLLAPAMGAQLAGFAMGGVTLMAIAGRALLGRYMPIGADRRMIACYGYMAQCAGSICFWLAAGTHAPLLWAGVVLFGLGFGNALSLPPLIAQVEFVKNDVARVASLIVALAQTGYGFAPALFALAREVTLHAGALLVPGEAPVVFIFSGALQALAIVAFLSGRIRR